MKGGTGVCLYACKYIAVPCDINDNVYATLVHVDDEDEVRRSKKECYSNPNESESE